LSFHGVDTRNSVDALCAVAGWTRHDLADRLGVGPGVLDYYSRGTAPLWLAPALVGIAVVELGFSIERAVSICTAPPADSEAR
jgi:hypothetical protein